MPMGIVGSLQASSATLALHCIGSLHAHVFACTASMCHCPSGSDLLRNIVLHACRPGLRTLVFVLAICDYSGVGGGVGPTSHSLPVRLAAADHHGRSHGVLLDL